MLTQQAFNALLKTLEEPPAHVKFIFCTTDPQKIPITVLSRCQRFDFAPVQADEISKRLKEIAENEGVTADDAALALLARRANGSMRDSQSLLEQLFSFCGDNISVEEVNQLLGTADISRIAELAQSMSAGDAAASMNHVDRAISEGVDAGQLTQQLLGFYRDMMVVRVGCGEETLLSCTAADQDELKRLGDQLGLQSILAIVQILDGAIVRMQSSVHTRTLLEVAVVRICNLENLDSISDLVQALSSGGTVTAPSGAKDAPPAKKNETPGEPAAAIPPGKSAIVPAIAPESDSRSDSGALTATQAAEPEPSAASNSAATKPGKKRTSASPATMIAPAEIKSIWEKTLDELSDMTADMAREYEKIELLDANKLAVTLTDSYNRDMCNRPERKQMLESAMERISGQKFRIDFLLSATPSTRRPVRKPKMTRRQQILQLHETPIVKKAMEVFDAEIVDFHEINRPR
jgi:DNA polymerase-3 subunit gamma/tau